MLLNYNGTYVKWGYLLYNGGLRIYLGSKRPLLLVKLGLLLNINLYFLL
jgi:hypothetical protein